MANSQNITIVFRNRGAKELTRAVIIPSAQDRRITEHFQRHPEGYVEMHLPSGRIAYGFTLPQALANSAKD